MPRESPRPTWWKLGLDALPPIASDPTTITTAIGNVTVNTGVASSLLSELTELYTTAAASRIEFLVDSFAGDDALITYGATNYIILRIDDELIRCWPRYPQRTADGKLSFRAAQRGNYDTTPVPHAIGARVIFTHLLKSFANKWDGTPYTFYAVSSTGFRQRGAVTPPTPVHRAVRPPVPTNVSINGSGAAVSYATGDLTIYWTDRSRGGTFNHSPPDPGQGATIEFWHGGVLKLQRGRDTTANPVRNHQTCLLYTSPSPRD